MWCSEQGYWLIAKNVSMYSGNTVHGFRVLGRPGMNPIFDNVILRDNI